jgi:hypothetical protein
MGKLLRHRQTKGPVSARLHLNCRATPRLHPIVRLVVGCYAMKPLIVLAFLSGAAVLIGQSDKSAPEPKFSELWQEDRARLDHQRALIAAAGKQRYGTAALSRTKRDLPIIQRLFDDKAFKKSQTYELQCLGVVFGDVLASELPLRWMMITDEYGTDPTLRFRNTSININALTMISKRVERDEPLDVSRLLQQNREALAEAEKTLR